MNIIKRNTEHIMDTCKEMQGKLSKCLSCYWNAGQAHNLKIGNKSFENVAEINYSRITNQSCICEETKGRLNTWNACYHSVKNSLSSYLVFKNIKI